MNAQYIFDLIEKLTGKPVRPSKEGEKEQFKIERELLNRLLSREDLKLNWNEFNELLLICNKERISKGFFDFFLRKDCTKKEALSIEEINEGIENFRIYAMLAYGNFIYPYRELSSFSRTEIKKDLEFYLRNSKEIENKIKRRPPAVESLNEIKKQNTHFTGYLTGDTIEQEYNTVKILDEFIRKWNGNMQRLTEDLDRYIRGEEDEIKHLIMQVIIKYKKYSKKPTKAGFKEFVKDSLKSIEKVKTQCDKIIKKAEMNTYIYLTWDYMDVYLATSMREKYDFESLYQFAKDLFSKKHLRDLKLRYFDPTQAKVESRIDKGLMEGLMLKRAKCTVYSVQDTDTLGKDSELASTLAQGKPVIAYIPNIEVKEHVIFMKKQPLVFLRDKLDLLNKEFRNADVQEKCIEWFKKQKEIKLKIESANEFLEYICKVANKINEASHRNIWESIKIKTQEINRIKKELGEDFHIICNFIAIADEIFYDRRAKLIKNQHPLGVQINLSTGVANGVLLVRDIDICAELIYNIIVNKLDFDLKFNEKYKYWYLEEKLSGCIYRVVTKDAKLTNSFWNFYLPKEEGERNG